METRTSHFEDHMSVIGAIKSSKISIPTSVQFSIDKGRVSLQKSRSNLGAFLDFRTSEAANNALDSFISMGNKYGDRQNIMVLNDWKTIYVYNSSNLTPKNAILNNILNTIYKDFLYDLEDGGLLTKDSIDNTKIIVSGNPIAEVIQNYEYQISESNILNKL